MIFEAREFDRHEHVSFVQDDRVGLRAIIAIHSSELGPAAGGCRMWSYSSSSEALTDALRLSRGMSLKNAVADLPLGGGKAVIMQPDAGFGRQALMEAFGAAVDRLGGRYWTAEDVGTTVADMEHVATNTPFVAGRAGCSGDPSPFTAKGVVECLRVGVSHVFGAPSLSGITVAVQGLGSVGLDVCRLLREGGASLVVADLNRASAEAARERFGATIVRIDEISSVECDVFSPCALGGVLSECSIKRMRARLVCGAANNQLAMPEDAMALEARGITYAPDFIVNAGGICSVASEILGIKDPAWLTDKVNGLGRLLRRVLVEARDARSTSASVAERLALERIEKERGGGALIRTRA